MELKDLKLAFNSKSLLLPRISYPQFGATLGFHFRFRTTTFSDFFFGLEGKLNVTELIKDDDDITHIVSARFIIGYLFRTNHFPIQRYW